MYYTGTFLVFLSLSLAEPCIRYVYVYTIESSDMAHGVPGGRTPKPNHHPKLHRSIIGSSIHSRMTLFLSSPLGYMLNILNSFGLTTFPNRLEEIQGPCSFFFFIANVTCRTSLGAVLAEFLQFSVYVGNRCWKKLVLPFTIPASSTFNSGNK